jgi:hypothetical protein
MTAGRCWEPPFKERRFPNPPSNLFVPFFETLKAFLLKQPQKASFIQELLDIPLLDTKAIYEELR